MNFLTLGTKLFVTAIAGLATFIATTSTLASIIWIFEEPETPEVLKD